ncbi:hypothetical protein EJ05DRAFT_498135 [Pseudovirgaria hyperparasitica]|uniref:Uncharacterized protein n=1 Tax=Pseudovirgaria hyperparasitica TaxID=470096 RepID=A0A6A6WDB2_9PEZI|nr:uncharacterized protein EJ05DRAFT_498135 [Pseudovirgaria hyperparasitica]KAF2760169.1 hypothetical protein EJ05DRAFT_498135 [Pseudovirgaria hyperparasitica]
MGFFDKLQAKLEYYRLEQRYTRRSKRTTFISEAHYIDGEYVYGPTSPTSYRSSFSSRNGPSTKVKEISRS